MKTVLVTGCSSGFGLEIARYFHDRGWRVVATMRKPQDDILPADERMRVLALDVTNAESIAAAIEAAGPIDVLVNNAGIGLLSALEAVTPTMLRDTFETNTFGTMAMVQAVLPQFRERKSGTIVNVTSSVTLMPLPLLSVYTASKAAVTAFTESVALELAPFNVRLRLVVPGRSPTRFGQNAQARVTNGVPDAYAEIAKPIFERMRQPSPLFTRPEDVAEAVWRAVEDPNSPMRIPAGADAVALADQVRAA